MASTAAKKRTTEVARMVGLILSACLEDH